MYAIRSYYGLAIADLGLIPDHIAVVVAQVVRAKLGDLLLVGADGEGDVPGHLFGTESPPVLVGSYNFV